jgi:prefoldin subunit 5
MSENENNRLDRIEQKLERLTERHEALAQSLELLRDSVHEQGENIDKLITLSESQTSHIETLMSSAQAFLQAVQSHERRIQHLEGGH